MIEDGEMFILLTKDEVLEIIEMANEVSTSTAEDIYEYMFSSKVDDGK